MQDRSAHRHSRPLPKTTRAAIIDAMRHAPMTAGLTYTGLKTVMATRVMAMCGQAERDPLLELTQRFACLETAKAFMAFADAVGRSWPEAVQVLRPCCQILTPDEWSIANIAEAACNGDRQQFENILQGFVRAERHDRLFDLSARLVAAMQ